MQTIQSLCDHKIEHKCKQYSHYVIISLKTNADNIVTLWSLSCTRMQKIQLLCDDKRKHKCWQYSHSPTEVDDRNCLITISIQTSIECHYILISKHISLFLCRICSYSFATEKLLISIPLHPLEVVYSTLCHIFDLRSGFQIGSCSNSGMHLY
jgi:hypothetical protein